MRTGLLPLWHVSEIIKEKNMRYDKVKLKILVNIHMLFFGIERGFSLLYLYCIRIKVDSVQLNIQTTKGILV